MKPLILLAFIALSGIWAVGGETFRIISLTHQIRAQTDGQVIYDQTSGDPLQFESRQDGATLSASTDLGRDMGFHVFQTGAELEALQLDDSIDRSLQVSASVSMLFKPLGNEADIHSSILNEGFGTRSFAEITNLTTGQQLLSTNLGTTDGIYPLIEKDQYLLTLQSELFVPEIPPDYRFTIGTLFFSVSPPVMVIPAPASLLMSVIGVATCLLGYRCRTAPKP